MASIKEIAHKLVESDIRIKEEQKKCEEYKVKIQQYFDKKGKDIIELDSEINGIAYRIKKSESLNVKYDVEALGKKLEKELFDDILEKQYTISDIRTLTKLIKNAGIPAMAFRRCIHVNKSINKAKMNQLYNVGDITKKDIDKCFTAKITKTISIQEIKE